MATATKQILSGSTDGEAIVVDQTGPTPGTVIHTADASLLDEIWLFAANIDTVDRKLTVHDDNDKIILEITIPAESGLITVLPGLIYTNSTAIEAYAAAANVIHVSGFVNRITN